MGDAREAGSSGAGRPLRFAVIGAGMAGILSARSSCARPGYDDFTVYEKADRARRHLAREHLSRASPATCPPISTATRSRRTPSGATASRRGPRSRPTSRAWRERHGVSRRASASARRSTRCEFRDGRWRLETKRRPARRGRRRDRRDRRAPPPERARRSRASTASRGALLPQRALGPRRAARRPPRRRRRHRLDRGADRRRAIVDRVREALALPAHRAVDHAAGEPGLQRGRARRVPPPARSSLDADARRHRRSSSTAFSSGLVDANSPQMKMIEDGVPREPRAERARPGAAREAAPELPRGVQAPGHVARLLPTRSSSRTPRS